MNNLEQHTQAGLGSSLLIIHGHTACSKARLSGVSDETNQANKGLKV